VVGTTGLLAGDHAAIDEVARVIPVLQSPNMSLGVNLLFALAAQVARRLGDDYDIEVVEAHHRYKKDAPSGTALGIVKAICDATGKSPERDVVYGRHGEAERRRGEIGVHAVRVGDVVGDHTVTFGAPGERIELTHLASTRDVFARGALRAAAWLHGKPVGRFSMSDVLGL
jgi:4-hydroxy-tetrahydrodipicolinate reductase